MATEIKDAILKKVGASGSTIRLGRGVLGRTGTAVVVATLALGTIALRLPESSLIYLALLVVGLAVSYMLGAFWFAFKNPGAALLEESDLIRWQSMQAGARDLPGVIDGEVISDPRQSADKLIEGGNADA